MIGLGYFLMFVVAWFVVSVIAVRYLSWKKKLKKVGAKLLATLLIFLLPFSYDILKSCYMNITFNNYCSGNHGILKTVKGKPDSFLVRAGGIRKLFSENVKFVEWRLEDKYSRLNFFSSDLPEGLYKAYLRPIGDPDCEAFNIVFSDPDFLERALSTIKNKRLDQCIAIVKIDRLMAKYKYGKISYVAKTPYGYSVNITDKYITNLFTDEKEGLSRVLGTSWDLPFVDFIFSNSMESNNQYFRRCRNSKTTRANGWQDLFEYEKGDE